jgi:hypothetical protein
VVVCVAFVSLLTSVTLAFGTMAPLGSVTVPMIVPELDVCAQTGISRSIEHSSTVKSAQNRRTGFGKQPIVVIARMQHLRVQVE